MNAAKMVIHSLKNHFIVIICGTDPNFNIALWDKVIPQDLITLNILHMSNMSPNLSAYSQLYSMYDFNCILIVQLGVRVMVHDKSYAIEI